MVLPPAGHGGCGRRRGPPGGHEPRTELGAATDERSRLPMRVRPRRRGAAWRSAAPRRGQPSAGAGGAGGELHAARSPLAAPAGEQPAAQSEEPSTAYSRRCSSKIFIPSVLAVLVSESRSTSERGSPYGQTVCPNSTGPRVSAVVQPDAPKAYSGRNLGVRLESGGPSPWANDRKAKTKAKPRKRRRRPSPTSGRTCSKRSSRTRPGRRLSA